MRDKGIEKFYSRTAWRRLRITKLKHTPLCEHCEAQGMLTQAQEVDHIVPIKQGGNPYDMLNLQSLCVRCHSIKTRVDNGGQVKGVDASTGAPVDPNHWWNS